MTEEVIDPIETTAATDAAIESPAVDAAPAAADPVADVEPVAAADAGHPTVAQAEAMFAENPGLSWVLTESGNLSRDGVLVPRLAGE